MVCPKCVCGEMVDRSDATKTFGILTIKRAVDCIGKRQERIYLCEECVRRVERV